MFLALDRYLLATTFQPMATWLGRLFQRDCFTLAVWIGLAGTVFCSFGDVSFIVMKTESIGMAILAVVANLFNCFIIFGFGLREKERMKNGTNAMLDDHPWMMLRLLWLFIFLFSAFICSIILLGNASIIRIIGHLSYFFHDSAFLTAFYFISCNPGIPKKKKKEVRALDLAFDGIGEK